MDIRAIIMLIVLSSIFISIVIYARKNSDLTDEDIKYKNEYTSSFYNEEIELMILARDNCKGGPIIGDWFEPSGRFYAAVDCKTGELLENTGRIEWLVKKSKDSEKQDYVFDIQKNHIYKLLVRKCIPTELEEYQSKSYNNRFMVVKVLEADCHNEILEQLKDKYTKEVVLDNELGHFILNRDFSWFETKMNWNGCKVNVYLETDADLGETADTSLNTLKKYAANTIEFDNASREFAASELLELANDWQTDYYEDDDEDNEPEPITKEEFIKRMRLEEISIDSYGTAKLYYNDDDMFLGHVIVILIDNDGEYGDAEIEG